MKKISMYENGSFMEMEVMFKTNPLVARGTIENYSSVLTRLIQDTGRFCLHYASDLFILWKNAFEFIEQAEESGCGPDEFGFAFGLRESGVDSAKDIAKNIRYSGGVYRALYVLYVVKENGIYHLYLNEALGLMKVSLEEKDNK